MLIVKLLSHFDHCRKLSDVLPDCQLVDVGLDTSVQRMIKSKEEMSVIKLGAATADVGGAACSTALSVGGEGTMEWEVARDGVAAMYKYIR